MAANPDAPPAAGIEERSGEYSSSVPRRVKVLAVAVLAVMLVLIVYGYTDRPWSGRIGVSDKKFWDYLDLLIVPAALALVVYWLNRRQIERDQQAEDAQQVRALAVESQRAQDEALQAYLDQMGQLLLEHALREARPGDALSTVARARTLTVLGRLDGGRKRSVLQFLYEADLIKKDRLVVDLEQADLRGAELDSISMPNINLYRVDLRWANVNYSNLHSANLHLAELGEANLNATDLGGADMRQAYLQGARLTSTSLRSANLRYASLEGAILRSANLENAKLQQARLRNADLTNVQGVTWEELKQQTKHIEDAIKPDGERYEEWRRGE